MEAPVLYEKKDTAAIITLNRPERHNSINQDLLTHLYNYLDEASASSDVNVVIITGNGKSFCSGIDLSVIGTDDLFDPRGDGRDMPDIFADCKKPVIGAVNGHAITGGFEIALNCDFLIASELASFADTHVKVGIHPGWGMTQLLQQAVGQRMAKQMSFTGQFVNAAEAHRIGLVNEVVPHENLLPRCLEIAGQISSVNLNMLPVIKGLIECRNRATHDEACSHERFGFRKFVEENLKK